MSVLLKKLNFKAQKHILILHPPDTFRGEMTSICQTTSIITESKNVHIVDFTLIFVSSPEEISVSIADISHRLTEDPTIWYCYPKKSSKKYTTRISRDIGWEKLGEYNLECVRQISIDDDWSALRFRKSNFIKKLTRKPSFALSPEGKQRTKLNK